MINKMKFFGMFGVPCYKTEEEYIDGMKTAKYYTNSNFVKQYNEFIAAMQITAMCAKSYIIQNWKSVDDWSDLEVSIYCNKGISTNYYKYVPDAIKYKRGIVEKVFKDLDLDNKKRHNPIVSVENMVLDPTDSDFSVKINGVNHNWIDDESVILIAEYIENKLNKKEDN